jgi:hypothetical protein
LKTGFPAMIPPSMKSIRYDAGALASLTTVAGAAAALGVLEIVLRFFVSPAYIPRPRIAADSLHLPVVARQQIEEGIGTAHYSVAGARHTGNPPAGRDVMVVILGDSYVMAREVADHETMGSQLERTARANGVPLDVRQYGWSGASAAQYLVVSHEVLTRWHPRRVVVALSENDLDLRALNGDWPRLRVDAHGNSRVVGPPMDTVTGPPYLSTLWMLTERRWATLRRSAPSWARARRGPITAPVSEALRDSTPPPDSTEIVALPAAVVRALAKSYGQNLTLVYMAEIGLSDGFDPTPAETRFLSTCREIGVSCVSSRAEMLAARQRGIAAHGLSTRLIGYGHLNANGHGVIAAVIWKALLSDSALADGRSHR